jgi:hypothetical protein
MRTWKSKNPFCGKVNALFLLLALVSVGLSAYADNGLDYRLLGTQEAELVLGAGSQFCSSNPCNTCNEGSSCDNPFGSCGKKYVSGGGNPGFSCIAGTSTCVLSSQVGDAVGVQDCICWAHGVPECRAMFGGTCQGKLLCCQSSPCP